MSLTFDFSKMLASDESAAQDNNASTAARMAASPSVSLPETRTESPVNNSNKDDATVADDIGSLLDELKLRRPEIRGDAEDDLSSLSSDKTTRTVPELVSASSTTPASPFKGVGAATSSAFPQPPSPPQTNMTGVPHPQQQQQQYVVVNNGAAVQQQQAQPQLVQQGGQTYLVYPQQQPQQQQHYLVQHNGQTYLVPQQQQPQPQPAQQYLVQHNGQTYLVPAQQQPQAAQPQQMAYYVQQ